ncbi:hypothetical protein XA68_15258 [Ophiocordyceps unilateralis]|uniref:Uncharacterized protein n=1 Tax=Ophiocordyceps unilateralis TaxID=268505 RepID=A0A2A9P7J3_OPHUN|nr:hypothetical protein XA68_15258 [Ophiocordyceps unilateralis]
MRRHARAGAAPLRHSSGMAAAFFLPPFPQGFPPPPPKAQSPPDPKRGHAGGKLRALTSPPLKSHPPSPPPALSRLSSGRPPSAKPLSLSLTHTRLSPWQGANKRPPVLIHHQLYVFLTTPRRDSPARTFILRLSQIPYFAHIALASASVCYLRLTHARPLTRKCRPPRPLRDHVSYVPDPFILSGKHTCLVAPVVGTNLDPVRNPLVSPSDASSSSIHVTQRHDALPTDRAYPSATPSQEQAIVLRYVLISHGRNCIFK